MFICILCVYSCAYVLVCVCVSVCFADHVLNKDTYIITAKYLFIQMAFIKPARYHNSFSASAALHQGVLTRLFICL